MNDQKPLNIPADPVQGPDIEVKTDSYTENKDSSVSSNVPTQNIPETKLQESLKSTISQIVPPPQAPAPTTTTPTKESNKDSGVNIPESIKNFLQKPIRTYESDVAEIMSKNKASVASMVIAEAKKDERETPQEGNIVRKTSDNQLGINLKKIALVLASLVVIALGIYAGYYLYNKSALSLPPPQITPIIVPSIITPDNKIALNISGLSPEIIRSQVGSTLVNSPSDVKIYELVLEEGIEGNVATVTASDFIEKAELLMPSVLERALTDRWMLGAYTETSGIKSPFMILTTDFFQNAFSGMLAWESDMPQLLADLFVFEEKARASDDTSTSSIDSYFNIRGTFFDKQIKNRDVREFISRSGEILFLYSFVDKDTLVFTTSASALMAILERIEKSEYIR